MSAAYRTIVLLSRRKQTGGKREQKAPDRIKNRSSAQGTGKCHDAIKGKG